MPESKFDQLREVLMNAGYGFSYAYKVEGKVAYGVYRPDTNELVATLVHGALAEKVSE